MWEQDVFIAVQLKVNLSELSEVFGTELCQHLFMVIIEFYPNEKCCWTEPRKTLLKEKQFILEQLHHHNDNRNCFHSSSSAEISLNWWKAQRCRHYEDLMWTLNSVMNLHKHTTACKELLAHREQFHLSETAHDWSICGCSTLAVRLSLCLKSLLVFQLFVALHYYAHTLILDLSPHKLS